MPAKKVCAELTCPRLIDGPGRCAEHRQAADRARGTRQQRGYDKTYEQARDVALDGATHCRTCGQVFAADNPATGGHVRAIRNGGSTGHGIRPECRRCNYGWRRSGT